jgi:hypothetical protein
MITKNYLHLLIIIFSIILCSVAIFFSDKSLNGDGYYWLYRTFKTISFEHDILSYRFITYFTQILPVFFVNIKLDPFYVLKGFVLNQVIVYLIFPFYFIYKFLKTKDKFYLCPLLSFVSMNISTDSFLTSLAGETSMFTWILFNLCRKRTQTVRRTVCIILISIILMFSYETAFLMSIMCGLLLVSNLINKSIHFSTHTIIQFISLISVVIINIYIALISISIEKVHSGQFIESLMTIPSQQGLFIVLSIFYYTLISIVKKYHLLMFLALTSILIVYIYKLPFPLFESGGIFGDSFHMRTWTLPITSLIAFLYVYKKQTPSFIHLTSITIITSTFSIYGSYYHYKDISDFKNKLSNVNKSLVLPRSYFVNSYGISTWNFIFKSIAYTNSRIIKKLICIEEYSDTDCYKNLHFDYIPEGEYLIWDRYNTEK